MPTATCKCGRITNSTVSNYWDTKGEPTECYAAWDEAKARWVEGCALGKGSDFERAFAQGLINGDMGAIKLAGKTR